jgi:hypothetical protein
LSERLDRLRNLVLTQLRPEEAVASLDDLGAPAIRLGELFVAEGEASYRGESGAIPF